MEGFSYTCVTRKNGGAPHPSQVTKYNLKPSLQIFAALYDRSPNWVTPKRERKFTTALQDSMLPAKSFTKSNYFTDDNDESAVGGGRIKPVFNVEVVSENTEALMKLKEKLHLISTKKLPSYAVWPRRLNLGRVHMEGSLWVPHFCYVGR